jgi:hypothetical protein
LKERSFNNIEEGVATTRQVQKQRRKHLSLSVIEEEESGGDSMMCEEKKNAHLMDMIGHLIHILKTFFNFIS